MSLSSLLRKSHIALSTMNGARSFFVWFDTTDVNRISDRTNTKAYSSIRIDFQYCVRPTKWCFILVLGTLAQHDFHFSDAPSLPSVQCA